MYPPAQDSGDWRQLVLTWRQEFWQTWYDGITGLVTQPQSGWKQGGMGEMAKGVGKGVGGVLLKPQAGTYTADKQTQFTNTIRSVGTDRVSPEWCLQKHRKVIRKQPTGLHYLLAHSTGGCGPGSGIGRGKGPDSGQMASCPAKEQTGQSLESHAMPLIIDINSPKLCVHFASTLRPTERVLAAS